MGVCSTGIVINQLKEMRGVIKLRLKTLDELGYGSLHREMYPPDKLSPAWLAPPEAMIQSRIRRPNSPI